GADAVRAEPDAVGDPRPGAPLPPDRGRRPPRVHGDGGAVPELRRGGGGGEPFLNYDAVVAAARRLPKLGITHRRTTVSTVGWMPGLTRFVDEVKEPIRLAISIHAAESGLRSELMPVNDRYPLPSVLEECRRYFELRRRQGFVEYVMLGGVNDTPGH